MSNSRNLAILLFDDAEVLDFCGPFEVFSVANRTLDAPAFKVFMVTAKPGAVNATNGFSVNPDFEIANCPQPELLLIPGGRGTRREMNNEPLIEWIKLTAIDADLVLSVCTGALLLGKAGLLDGLEVTTHHVAYELLRGIVPSATVHEDRRFVDNGRVITSAGIAAGIDMSLHVVERLLGADAAASTANHMEYPWRHQIHERLPLTSTKQLTQFALELETQVWRAVVEKDGAVLSRLLDDNYLEITLEGQRVKKTDVVASSPQIDEIDEYEIESPQVVSFDGNTLLFNYHLTMEGTVRGAAIEPRERWATSLWSNQDGGWLCCFFQQSPYQRSPESNPQFTRNVKHD